MNYFLKLLCFSLLAMPDMTKAMEQPAPKEYSQQDIQKMLEQKRAFYLQRLHVAANKLAAQDELAALNNFIQIMSEKLYPLSKMKEVFSTSEPTKVTVKKDFLNHWTQRGATFTTPECIDFSLQAINKQLFNPTQMDMLIAEYEKSNNPEVQKLIILLNEDKSWDEANKLYTKLNANFTLLLTRYYFNSKVAYFENSDTPLQISNSCKPTEIFLQTLSTDAPKTGDTSIKLNPNNISRKLMEAGLAIDSSQEVFTTLEKLHTMRNTFLESYQPIRPDLCKLYESIRKEITYQILKNKSDKTLAQFSKKLYYSDDQNDSLPNKLPGTIPEIKFVTEIRPIEPTATLPEKLEEPKQSRITHNANTKKKGGNRKNQAYKQTAPEHIEEISQPSLVPEKARKNPRINITCVNDSLHNMKLHAYLSVKQKNKIADFAYHPRIYEWFKDPERALQRQGYNDPNNPKYALRNTAASYHGFSTDIDKYMREYGTTKEETDNNGKPIHFIALPGHIERNNERRFVIYGYAIDPETKICYHRCIEERNPEDLLGEYLHSQAWHVTLEELANNEINNP